MVKGSNRARKMTLAMALVGSSSVQSGVEWSRTEHNTIGVDVGCIKRVF